MADPLPESDAPRSDPALLAVATGLASLARAAEAQLHADELAHGDLSERQDKILDGVAALTLRIEAHEADEAPALKLTAQFIASVLGEKSRLVAVALTADEKAAADRAETRAIWFSRAKAATPIVLLLLGWAADHFLMGRVTLPSSSDSSSVVVPTKPAEPPDVAHPPP